MSEFAYTKGWLVNDDLPWDVNEYLQGSETINDCCVAQWATGGVTRRYALLGTNNDAVFIRIYDSVTSTTIPNVLEGYIDISGGITCIAYAGNYIYAVPAAAPNLIYIVGFSEFNGGAITPVGPNPHVTLPGTYEITSLHGDRIGAADFLYYTANDSATGISYLYVHNLTAATSYRTTLTGSDDPGFLPRGQFDGALYLAMGRMLHVFYHPGNIAADNFTPDCSYGYIGDEFPGASLDELKWSTEETGNMISCFSVSNALLFNTNTSGPGAAQANAYYNAYCVERIMVQVSYGVTAWGDAAPGDDNYLELRLSSADFQTQYLIRYGKIDGGGMRYYRMEAWHGGVMVFSQDVPADAAYDTNKIAVGRVSDGVGGYKVRFGVKLSPIAWNVWEYSTGVGTGALTPILSVYDNTGSNTFAGALDDFKACPMTGDTPSFEVPAIYRNMTDEEMVAAAVREASVTSERPLAFLFTSGVQVVETDESDEGGASEAGATVGALSAVSNGTGIALGGSWPLSTTLSVAVDGTGIRYYDVASATPTLRRTFTAAYDHAQPLTDVDMACVDAWNDRFIYGCEADFLGIGSGDDLGFGYGAGGSDDGGGAGCIIPDFTAPTPSSAWAEAFHDDTNRIRSGANAPYPVPIDYLHMHVERQRTDAGGEGDWKRLKTSGWVTYSAPGWDHSTDVMFLYDATLGSMTAAIQDPGLSDAMYKYRWVAHDEAGNQGNLKAQTLYFNHAEYLDEPVITAFVANGGISPTTTRAIPLAIGGHSGSDSTAESGKIYQVRFWNNGESEGDAEWRMFVAGASYEFNLTVGDGIKTVYARCRCVGYSESAVSSTTIELVEAGAVTGATFDYEPIMICHGANPINNFNFTGDKSTRLISSETLCPGSEDPNFPRTNVQQYDLGVPWKSVEWGTASWPIIGGADNYTTVLTWELNKVGVDMKIEMFAILAHNFAEIYSYPARYGYGSTFHLELHYATAAAWPLMTKLVDLAELRNRDYIVHRPRVAACYWRLVMKFLLPNGIGAAMADAGDPKPPWSIGRIVLNESALCWQPPDAFNIRPDFRPEIIDPSIIAHTDGSARRVVERDMYQTYRFAWDFLPQTNHDDLATIYRWQGARRPVLAIVDPINVKIGTDEPAASDTIPKALYGFFPNSMEREFAVNNYARGLTLTVEEARG